MHTAMARISPGVALFYVGVVVIGVYMVLNLFLAILLDSLDQVGWAVGGWSVGSGCGPAGSGLQQCGSTSQSVSLCLSCCVAPLGTPTLL